MKIRTSIVIGAVILITTLVTITTLKVKGDSDFVQTEISVVINPLKVGNSIVPLEIVCKPVITIRPDTLDAFSCKLINRTNKSIRASSVMYSIVVDSNGKEDRSSSLDTVDTFIHPDLADLKKPIEPGGSLSIAPPGPITEPDSVIKRLEIEPVYIEFSDGTTAGVVGKGAEIIANLREGAARYKNAFRQEYLNRGRSLQAIIPLLEENAPLGFPALNFQQNTGAKQYRKLLRKKLQRDGIETLNNILNK